MPPVKERKTRSWLTRNRNEKEISHQRQTRPKRKTVQRQIKALKEIKVDNLIRRFLDDLAVLNKSRNTKTKSSKNKDTKTKRLGHPPKNSLRGRPRKELSPLLSYDSFETTSKSILDSTADNTSQSTDSRSSTTGLTSAQSNPSIHLLKLPSANSRNDLKNILQQKLLIDTIKKYIKDDLRAVEEKAKRYMTEAISFGMNLGYLKPTDNSGHFLEVASTLPAFKRNILRDTVEEQVHQRDVRRRNVIPEEFCLKPIKKRNLTEMKNRERSREVIGAHSMKRPRNKTSATKFTSRVEKNKKGEDAIKKKKTKIVWQQSKPQKKKSSQRRRSRRSPTPWRIPTLKLNEEENNNAEPVTDDTRKEHSDQNHEKEKFNEIGIIEANQRRHSTLTSLGNDEIKNMPEESTSIYRSTINMDARIQEPISTQQGDDSSI